MLLDTQNLFCEEQSITSDTAVSANVICFGKNDVSFVPVVIQAVSDFSTLTSLKVDVQTDDNPDFSSATTLTSASMSVAELKQGATFPITYLPKGNQGYMRLQFVVTGNAETTGKITAGVVAGNGLSYHDIM